MSEERMSEERMSEERMSEEQMSESRGHDRALHLTRLHVRSAPGIDDGGFVLDRLSPRVNVVFGPNGSGKTTTAAAIEAVLWPDAAAQTRAALEARFTIDGVSWGARVEGRELRVQRDGQPMSPPAAPRADLSHRYRLHLHELLRTDHGGADFAAEIVRESAGGWDVPGAAARLGFVSQAPKGASESRTLATARTRLADAQRTERALQLDVERLDELEARLGRARDAQHRIALLESALTHARLRREHHDAATSLAAFDPCVGSLHGDEMEQIEALDARAAAAARDVEACERRRHGAEARQREALPSGALPDALIPDLRARLGELDALRPQADAAERGLAGAAEACESARRALGDAVDEARVANVNLASLGDLSRWAQEADQLRIARVVLERELVPLEGDEPPHPLDALTRGIGILEEWLTAPEPMERDEPGSRAYLVAFAAITLVAAALFGALARPSTAALAVAGVTGLVAIVMLVLALRRTSRSDTGGDRRATHAESFARLPLPRPTAWERDAISSLLGELRAQEVLARESARHRQRRVETERRLRELDPRWEEIERRRVELCERLGVAHDTDTSSLHWLMGRVGQWQDARTVLAAARAELASTREQQAAVRDAIGSRLAPHAPVPEVMDDAALRGAVEALERRERAYHEARDEARHAAREHDAATSELAQLTEEQRAILARAGIGEDDLALLAAWIESRTEFLHAREREAVAAAQFRSARVALEGMLGFEETLLDAPEAALESERAAARASAAEFEPLVRETSAIREHAERARSGHEVADALAAVEGATHGLREACQRDMDTAVGAALVRYVQDTTRDQQRPRVFHRARHIFRDVTHGRWRLDLEDGDTPAFRAYDNERDVGHSLDELSSATRMQLLVAVRLAFVEVQEREHGGARFPILLDETLGTCDDARARAMIETIATLAREGRQLFYFTAQWDEVEKWNEVMTGLDVEVAVHHLHELRTAARLYVERPEWTSLPRPALPSPDGMTHAEYGHALGVPTVSRVAPSIGGVHLWHLVDELPLLHHLLSRDVTTWGALEAIVEHGGSALLADFPGSWPRIRSAARALEAAHAAARVGHGRPVDRQAIIDSEVVSERFLDTVAELAEEFDGDASALVEHLGSGQVKYFRAEIAERLREWFVENGFLSEEEPLGREEVTHRAMAAVAVELNAGLLAPERLHRLVATALPHCASGVAGGDLPVAHPGLGHPGHGATAHAVPALSPDRD